VNDVVENVYTLDDARATAAAVRKMGMAGIHFWSLDRDQPCSKPSKVAEPDCSSMANVPAGAYRRILAPAAAGPREVAQ
jgi:chitinase